MRLLKFSDHLELQKKVQKYRQQNPDLTKAQVGKRFSLSRDMVNKYLRDEPPYPRGYLQTATRIGRPIEEVCYHKDRDEHWCRYCEGWFPARQFRGGGSDKSRHLHEFCVKGQKKA